MRARGHDRDGRPGGAGRRSPALELIKLGDQYVGVQSKDKVVQIRSEKSIASLTPDIWYVVYYDPDATFSAVEVKFGAGQKLDVSRPGRVLNGLPTTRTRWRPQN